jgi:hypothetical protein
MNTRETQAEQAGRKEKTIKLQRSEAEPATRSELSKKKARSTRKQQTFHGVLASE